MLALDRNGENADDGMDHRVDRPDDYAPSGATLGDRRGVSPADEIERAVIAGKPVRRGVGEPAAGGHGWGDSRVLPADLLYELLVRSDGGALPRAAVLVGLRISGRLNFEAAELLAPLIAHGCYFDEPVNLTAATAAEISLTACRLPGIAGDGLETRGDFNVSTSTVEVLGLAGARIGGNLVLSGATLTSAGYPPDLGSGTLRPPEIPTDRLDGVALVADGLQVNHDTYCDDGFSARGEVRLLGARIGGQLSFSGATLTKGLHADGLQVEQSMTFEERFSAEGPIRLPTARIGGQLSFSGATLDMGLNADGVEVGQNMYCDEGFVAGGDVNLLNGRIGGQLSLRGARLAASLIADGLQVAQDMYCDKEFEALGEVRLPGACIGALLLIGATLTRGLTADRLQVVQNLYCNDGFSAGGEVGLRRARIGQLSFRGATLAKGLDADRLQVDQDMDCGHEFSATGDIRLAGGRIGGDLSFQGATLSSTGVAVDLTDTRVDGALFLRYAERPSGMVALTGARVTQLFDSEQTWPASLRIDGCVYDRVEASEDVRQQLRERKAGGQLGWRTRLRRRIGGPPDVTRRLRWIRLAEDGEPRRTTRLRPGWRTSAVASLGAGYAPQPYTQLRGVYRQQGRDSDARRLGYERERRRPSQLGVAGLAWNHFLRWTVGYGYKPLRAAGLLGMLLVVGTLVFSSFHSNGAMTAIKDEHPPFVASIYTIDRLIPVVSFGLRDAFGPSGAAQWWAFAYTLLGWAITIAIVAGLNAAVRRD